MALVPVILLWTPFFLKAKSFWNIPLPQQGMATIIANYDGPLYIVAAKTLYNPDQIQTDYQFPLSNEYYSAHFPLFPLLIRLISPLLGYPYSMLFVSLFFSITALYFFNKHARRITTSTNALWLTFLFSIFPARWLIVRSVGSAEPLFVTAILASTYYFLNKKYYLAGIWGMIAQMTKSPGVLLFFAYLINMFFPNIKLLINSGFQKFWQSINLKKTYPIFLIPLGLILVFTFYYFSYGDFWVYFKSGDNIHLFFPPFQIFNYSAPWVGTFWLEEIIFIYAVGILSLFKLWKEKLHTYFYLSLIFFTSLLFVAHRDLLRYAIPVIPFFLFGFHQYLVKKEVKIALAIIIIPIYLYSLAFISQNSMPISNWSPFL